MGAREVEGRRLMALYSGSTRSVGLSGGRA
jgi:hypothetical protein